MVQTNYDLTVAERQVHEAQYGGYNDFPPNWRELTPAEFAKSMYFSYTPKMLEFRQMLDREHGRLGARKPCVSAHLNWFHDNTGFAIVNDFWGGTVKFYQFGCQHEFGNAVEEVKRRGIRLYAHDSVTFCPKCGYFAIHDSSD